VALGEHTDWGYMTIISTDALPSCENHFLVHLGDALVHQFWSASFALSSCRATSREHLHKLRCFFFEPHLKTAVVGSQTYLDYVLAAIKNLYITSGHAGVLTAMIQLPQESLESLSAGIMLLFRDEIRMLDTKKKLIQSHLCSFKQLAEHVKSDALRISRSKKETGEMDELIDNAYIDECIMFDAKSSV
jgi:hypothetical protein